jgi:hypothetical protein
VREMEVISWISGALWHTLTVATHRDNDFVACVAEYGETRKEAQDTRAYLRRGLLLLVVKESEMWAVAVLNDGVATLSNLCQNLQIRWVPSAQIA